MASGRVPTNTAICFTESEATSDFKKIFHLFPIFVIHAAVNNTQTGLTGVFVSENEMLLSDFIDCLQQSLPTRCTASDEYALVCEKVVLCLQTDLWLLILHGIADSTNLPVLRERTYYR